MRKKKMNSYKKLGIVMLLAAIGGGILGFVGSVLMGFGGDAVTNGIAEALAGMQKMMLPLLIMITVFSVLYGEMNLKKHRNISRNILETEDEECDRWEYEEERNGAKGQIVNTLSQAVCILVLSTGYSAPYINGRSENMLASCVVFLLCFVYDGFWQIRFVKLIQKTYPEKKGDPVSTKFQEQWLNSCDEAERTLIYRSAYKSYCVVNKWIPALLLLTMLSQLFFHTGMLAIVVVVIIWLVVMVTYLRSCVKLRKEKVGI